MSRDQKPQHIRQGLDRVQTLRWRDYGQKHETALFDRNDQVVDQCVARERRHGSQVQVFI